MPSSTVRGGENGNSTTSPTQPCALNPALASVTSALVLGETLSPAGVAGAAMVFAVLIASTWASHRGKAKQGRDQGRDKGRETSLRQGTLIADAAARE